eukprot:7134451-Prymnesium_polylepis.1
MGTGVRCFALCDRFRARFLRTSRRVADPDAVLNRGPGTGHRGLRGRDAAPAAAPRHASARLRASAVRGGGCR